MALIPGTLLAGTYRIVEAIGYGGGTVSFGDVGCSRDADEPSVYRAHDTRLDRQVALKALRAKCRGHEICRQRFRREASVVARLEHPNIVCLYGVSVDGDVPLMAMRLVQGSTLAMLERQKGRLQPYDAVTVLRGVASALDYVHAKGVLHRNLTPQNILIEGDVVNDPLRARTYLADFCISRIGPGTPLDRSSDIYSLAVVAYEMLTGRRPFVGDTPIEVLQQIAHEDAPPLRLWNPGLPTIYDCVFARSLSRNPGERHDSAGAFVDALQQGIATRLH